MPSIGREFGSVFLGDKNVALLVVSEGWAKVRDLYLLPTFQFVQVFVGGIQSPSMGRRPTAIDTLAPTETVSNETNGEAGSLTTV